MHAPCIDPGTSRDHQTDKHEGICTGLTVLGAVRIARSYSYVTVQIARRYSYVTVRIARRYSYVTVRIVTAYKERAKPP